MTDYDTALVALRAMAKDYLESEGHAGVDVEPTVTTYLEKAAAARSVEWVGSACPLNAVKGDRWRKPETGELFVLGAGGWALYEFVE